MHTVWSNLSCRGTNLITRDDILPMAEFSKIRRAKRQELLISKKNRRVPVGPDATFYFENYDTMWFQIHEMLFIEQGGEEQIKGELEAYNPMIPNGSELVATLMFEINDQGRRTALLAELGGVEKMVTLRFAEHVIAGRPEEDIDRSNSKGKASSVQFLHFEFSKTQIVAFCEPNNQVVIGLGHPSYSHMAVIAPMTQLALAGDFKQL